MHVAHPVRMRRIESVIETSVRTVAPEQNYLTASILWKIYKTDREILGKSSLLRINARNSQSPFCDFRRISFL